MRYSGEEIRRGLLSAAKAEWKSHVSSEESLDRITEYFQSIGWQWALKNAGVTTYSEAARRSHPSLLNWCGIFPAFCGLRVGNHLPGDQCVAVRLREPIARQILPSTYRLHSKEKWIDAGFERPKDPDNVQPGDLICVVTGEGKRYGDHVAIVEGKAGGLIYTIEGNAYGRLGNDDKGRGVVFRTRHPKDVRQIIRLEPQHFEEII